jgi:hypothetical protein
MIVIKRLLEYKFPDFETAVAHLSNRGVRGTSPSSWMMGKAVITETFYYNSQDAIDVLNAVVTKCVKGEPPDRDGICKYYPAPGDSPVCGACVDVSRGPVCTEQFSKICEPCIEQEKREVSDDSR